jgi:hypothetical protein
MQADVARLGLRYEMEVSNHQKNDRNPTHKTPEVQAWLKKHPRFNLHFTPTSASWLNLVERFVAEITTKRIRRGSYSCVDDLESATYDYRLLHNAKPKPFVWSKTADDIIARERRALDALDEIREIGNKCQTRNISYHAGFTR